MTKAIGDLFVYTAIYSSVLFLFAFFFNFKLSMRELPLKIIASYLLYEFLTDQVALAYDESPLVVFIAYSIFTVVELLLFSYCFYTIVKSKSAAKVIPIVGIGFAIFALIYFLTTKRRILDTVPIGVETIIVICFSCYYLFEQINDMSTVFVYDRYAFWLVTGMLLYLAGSCFIYIFANQVDAVTRSQLWIYTNIFIIIKKLLFAISILIFLKQKKLSRDKQRNVITLN
ncbi:MAG: hypothetical protein EOO16_14595 [Chitinophagaceae bacterium]|nr:MAG: hypothetical protein EOO16_14595 [Chitinophagaceae bacterium]